MASSLLCLASRLPVILCDDDPGNSAKLSPFRAPERKWKTGLLFSTSTHLEYLLALIYLEDT